jgi:hypothetical protein
MPFKSNDSLDDEILLDGSNGFTTGCVSATRADNISATSFSEARNIDYDDFGNLLTRPGATSITGNVINENWENISNFWNSIPLFWGSSFPANTNVISGFFFDTKASENLVVAAIVAGVGNIYFGNPSSSFQLISGSSFNILANYVYFAQLNERLYYSDGYNPLAYITASNTNQSVVANKVTSVTIINGGSGYTSIPAITFSAPPSGTTATGTAIVSGGQVVAITITNPGTGYTSAPTITFASGSAAATASIMLSAPAKPIYLTSHTQRLFCVSADTSNLPDTLYFSDILDGESWDPAGSVRVGGDGDPITGLYSWFANKLIVFKQRSIWAVDADPLQDPADWVISLISGNIGCVSHRSIAATGADVLFLSRDGIRSLAQIQAGTQTDVGLPLSAPISDIINRIDKTKYDYCDGICWNNRYMLAVPYLDDAYDEIVYSLLTEDGNFICCENGTTLGFAEEIQQVVQNELMTEGDVDLTLEDGSYLSVGSKNNNVVLVYHLLAKSWLGMLTNWLVTDFVNTQFSSSGPVLMFSGAIENVVNASSQIYAFNDYVPNTKKDPAPISIYRDGGASYESYVVSKAYNFNEPMVDKIGYDVQFSTENPYQDWNPEISFEYATDMDDQFNELASAVSIPGRVFKYQKSYNLISKGVWNNIQFKQYCPNGRMSVQSIITTAFPQTIKPQQ